MATNFPIDWRFRDRGHSKRNRTLHDHERQEMTFENGCANDLVMDSDEIITLGSSNMNDVRADDQRSSGSSQKLYENPYCKLHDIDPSADIVFSDLRSNTGARSTLNDVNRSDFRNNVQSTGDYDRVSDDVFNPTPLPRLRSSFPPRSSSAESASTASTANSVVGSSSHDQHQHQHQRRDSAAMVSLDDQTVQPNHYTSITSSLLPSSTRRVSASSCDSGAAGTMSSNPLHMETAPTPINSYLNQRTSQQRHQKKNEERNEDPKSIDEVMANELNKLSFKERESINEEIHGIDVPNAGVDESPELLRKSFNELDVELQKLRPECAAFDRSQRLFGATTYLNTEEFRIMFLRCDLFDCKKASRRFCDYADLMLEIFGDFALQRRPCLTDLTDLELRILEAGGYQVLPGRDRAGRRILGNLAFDAPKEFGVLSRLRTSIYVVLSILEDVETQQKGAIGISWWHNVSVDDFIIRKKVHERVNCVPLRLGAYHCCIPSEVKSGRIGKENNDNGNSGGVSTGMAQAIKAMAVLGMSSNLRPHLRFHAGSVVECIYALQSFGIHSDQIPVHSSSGKLKTKQHLKWLEFRRLKEESLKHHGHGHEFDRIIECPKQTDVLFGRGRPIMRHPGNATLRSVVQLKLEEYSSAKSKKQTTDVTWEVVRILKNQFCARFLKEENIENNGLGWVEVSNEIARQKVRIAFRDLRTKILKTNASEEKSTDGHAKTDGASNIIVNEKRKGESASPIMTPLTTFETPLLEQDSSKSVEKADSSTFLFLGMDGAEMKRQRRCF